MTAPITRTHIVAKSYAELEREAREAARAVGLRATKSRRRCDNRGGFRLVLEHHGRQQVVDGVCYELMPQEVIALCAV